VKKNNCQPRILYPAKLFFSLDREIRTFHDNDTPKWLKSTLQKTLKGIIHREEDEKQTQT
jgi:hypothetical protein